MTTDEGYAAVRTLSGPFGSALELSVPDLPANSETACHWLITSPRWHPLWSQYMLGGLRLRDNIPGMPEPNRQFPEATHELFVVALSPFEDVLDGDTTPVTYTPELLWDRYSRPGSPLEGKLPYLSPVNVAWQMTGTDEEMRQICALSAAGIVHGLINPETADAPKIIRSQWDWSLKNTLKHIRGEEHEEVPGRPAWPQR